MGEGWSAGYVPGKVARRTKQNETGNVPSDFLDNLANEGSLLGESTFPAGNTGLRVTEGHSAVALVDAVGEAFKSPKLPSVFFLSLISLPLDETT